GDSADGGSEIIDYLGNVLAKAGQGESFVANCEIDLGGLRRARKRADVENLLTRTMTQLWAQEYASRELVRPNGLADLVQPDGLAKTEQVVYAKHHAAVHGKVIAQLVDAGILR